MSGSVFDFGVLEPANPNRTKLVRFRNEKKNFKPIGPSRVPRAASSHYFPFQQLGHTISNSIFCFPFTQPPLLSDPISSFGPQKIPSPFKNPSPVIKNLVFLSLIMSLSCLIASTQPLHICLQAPSVILLCSKNLNKIFYLNENLTVLFMTCFIAGLLLLLTVLAFQELLSMGIDASLVVSEKIWNTISPMRK